MKVADDIRNVPQEWLGVVLWWLRGVNNVTADIRTPQLRQSVKHGYQLFVGLYSLVVVAAAVANAALVVTICRHRLSRDQTFRYLLNLALSNLAHGCIVVPLSVVVMLLHNWLFGAFLCYLIPVIQEIPLHASTLTHVLVVWDRLRYVRRPGGRRLSASVTSTAAWLLAVLVVLPYYRCTTYIDLGIHLQDYFEGVGICVSNLTRGIRIYARMLVIAMYVIPVCVMLRLHLSLTTELHRSLDSLAVVFDAAFSSSPPFRCEYADQSQLHPLPTVPNFASIQVWPSGCRERRLQQCLASMASVHCICLCPLMLLRIAKSGLDEGFENSSQFDVLFSVFVWMASLPCATTPLVFLFIYSERSMVSCVRKWLRISCRLFTTRPGVPEDQRPADTPARSLIQHALSREHREYCTTI